ESSSGSQNHGSTIVGIPFTNDPSIDKLPVSGANDVVDEADDNSNGVLDDEACTEPNAVEVDDDEFPSKQVESNPNSVVDIDALLPNADKVGLPCRRFADFNKVDSGVDDVDIDRGIDDVAVAGVRMDDDSDVAIGRSDDAVENVFAVEVCLYVLMKIRSQHLVLVVDGFDVLLWYNLNRFDDPAPTMTSPSPSSNSSTTQPQLKPTPDLISSINAFLTQKNLPQIGKDRIGLTPYPAWTVATACMLSSIPSVAGLRGWPALLPLVGFAGVFTGSGYITMYDVENGPSMTTAWGLVYTFGFAKHTFESRRPGPIALSTLVMGTTLVYGREFLDYWLG
ncbi:hypothetical protein HDU76_002035, partial [Blyttiomyces sp. JEL0837]